MAKLSANKLGLIVGIFAALWHAVWALLVGIGVAQGFLDWILPLHFVSSSFTVLDFTIVNALMIVVASFVGGYIFGAVFAYVWNWLNKK